MEILELDGQYSTTHRLARAIFNWNQLNDSGIDIPGVRNQGGLRTMGYVKSGTPEKPLVSVITVVFNGVATLETSIKSVLDQSYDNVEFIVIDGASTDGTVELIRRYGSVIDYWVSEKDCGIYDAMNKGIKLARGEWLALLNADDRYASNDALSLVANLKGVQVAASDVLIDTEEGLKRFTIDDRRPLFKNIPYMHTGIFVKSAVYDQIGSFRIDLKIASDIDFIFRVIRKRFPVHRFTEPLVVMKDGGASARNFKQGRVEYRRVYLENGGSRLLAYIGYFFSMVEHMLYRNKNARGCYRTIRRCLFSR